MRTSPGWSSIPWVAFSGCLAVACAGRRPTANEPSEPSQTTTAAHLCHVGVQPKSAVRVKWEKLAAAPAQYKNQLVALVGIANLQREMFWLMDSAVHPQHWLRFDPSEMRAGAGQVPTDIRYCDNVPVVMSGYLRQDGTAAGKDAGPPHGRSGEVVGFVLELRSIQSYVAHTGKRRAVPSE